jgi:general secretion pathway protein E
VRSFSIQYVRQHQILGLEPLVELMDSDQDARSFLTLAIGSPDAWPLIDVVSRRLKMAVRPIVTTVDAVRAAMNAAYAVREGETEEVLEAIQLESEGSVRAIVSSSEDLLEGNSRAPVIRLVNQVLFDAVVAGASDVHIQPYENCLMVRQRIDGILFDYLEIPKGLQEEVLARVKVLGKMNIAEKRLPQDGRASVLLGDRKIDLRIASLPTSHNERIVIRLLDKSSRLYTLDQLGMPSETLGQWQAAIRKDHGLVLVTGPTGSGKTTTLYGALQEINSKELNILTLEDPIEYQLDGISQTQINEKKGMTFASGMRNMLRQDPDIIMVGEIRDRETASMAIQASLTGHMVFSTLHTNDAPSAITRLLDLGVEPYLLSSCIRASLAQRLVRKLCVHCKEIGTEGIATPVGCERCRQSGFLGRIGLFELLIVDDSIRNLIHQRASASEIRKCSVQGGMTSLYEDGMRKIREGKTTRDEVLRVTSVESASE